MSQRWGMDVALDGRRKKVGLEAMTGLDSARRYGAAALEW